MAALEVEVIPQVSQTYRDYSPEFKAAAIAAYEANDCNLTGTAKALSVPVPTLDYWIRTADRKSEFQTRAKADLASEYEQIAFQTTRIAKETLDDPERASKIPFAALMTGGAVATDKMLVLRNQPNQITMTVERTELTILLQSALGVAIDSTDNNSPE